MSRYSMKTPPPPRGGRPAEQPAGGFAGPGAAPPPEPPFGKKPVMSRFLTRFLIHLGAIMLAASIGAEMALVGAYIGIISLLPKGDPRRPGWYVPVAAGAVQALLLAILGVPFPWALCGGGLLTLMLRIVQGASDIGLGWGTVFFFIIVSERCVSDCLAAHAIWAFASVPVVFAAAYCVYEVYRRRHLAVLLEEQLQEASASLQALVQGKYLSDDLNRPTAFLLTQVEALKSGAKGRMRDFADTVRRVDGMRYMLENLVMAARPGKSGWTTGLLKSANWGRDKETSPEAVRQALQALNKLLAEELARLEPRVQPGAAKDDADIMARIDVWEGETRRLLGKAGTVPPELARHVEAIAAESFEILKNMRQDANDRRIGDKFLTRYLPAVHKVVDDYVRLAAENVQQQEIAEALAKADDLMGRIEAAFRDEHAVLLRNDTVNFSAELDALDALLKMGGH